MGSCGNGNISQRLAQHGIILICCNQSKRISLSLLLPLPLAHSHSLCASISSANWNDCDAACARQLLRSSRSCSGLSKQRCVPACTSCVSQRCQRCISAASLRHDCNMSCGFPDGSGTTPRHSLLAVLNWPLSRCSCHCVSSISKQLARISRGGEELPLVATCKQRSPLRSVPRALKFPCATLEKRNGKEISWEKGRED